MKGWQLGFEALRATKRTSDRMADNLVGTIESRKLQTVDRKVRRRGYLIPGDDDPPPGSDILDYRGLVASDDLARQTSRDTAAFTVGRAINLDTGAPGQAVRLDVERIFQHAAVVAPPGSGKTAGIIVPWTVRLLRAGASVVVLDVTGTLGEQIREFSQASRQPNAPKVRTLRWTLHPRHPAHSWNPLVGVEHSDTLAIEGLRTALAGDEPADPRHRDFHDRDLRLLGSVIRLSLAAEPEASLTTVARAISSRDELERLNVGSRRHDLAIAWEDLSDSWTLRNKLEPFLDPQVRDVTTRSDFRLNDVLTEHTLLVVGAELELKSTSQAAAALLINRLMSHLQSRFDSHDGRPVVIVMDEAPILAQRIDLSSILATARATRTGVVLACQNVTQFGDDRASSSVFDSCDMMAVLPGASDHTIGRFQARLGDREVGRYSLNEAVGSTRRVVNVDRSSERMATIGVREILNPPFGRYPAFVHSRSLAAQPFVVELDRSIGEPE